VFVIARDNVINVVYLHIIKISKYSVLSFRN